MFRALGLVALFAASGASFAEDLPVRDPMRPFASSAGGAGAAAASRPRFALTGIVIAPTRRIAIVNGKPYAQGETVDGAELVAVEPAAVRLREHGAELVITLGRPDETRPPIVRGETVP